MGEFISTYPKYAHIPALNIGFDHGIPAIKNHNVFHDDTDAIAQGIPTHNKLGFDANHWLPSLTTKVPDTLSVSDGLLLLIPTNPLSLKTCVVVHISNLIPNGPRFICV